MTWLLKMAVSNPLVFWVIVAAIFAFGAVTGGSAVGYVQGLRITAEQQKTTRVQQAFDKFALDTYNTGLKAEAKKQEDEQKARDNLKKVQADHEKQIPTIRARAVANYLAAHSMPDDAGTSSGGGPVREDGSGIKLDDGASKECVPDQALIEDAAEDAAKVAAWIEYCQLNKCPVRPSTSTP